MLERSNNLEQPKMADVIIIGHCWGGVGVGGWCICHLVCIWELEKAIFLGQIVFSNFSRNKISGNLKYSRSNISLATNHVWSEWLDKISIIK